MGLFDRFRNKTNNTDNSNTISDTKNEQTPQGIDSVVNAMEEEIHYIETKQSELDNTPAAKKISSIAREEAISIDKEIKQKEFEKKYRKIVDFKREFDHIKGLKELGLQYTQPKSEYMKRYETLCAKNAMPQRNIDKIFLPYLIEKKSIGIITESEQSELNKILGQNKDFKDLLNATTTQSFTQDYNRSLIMLGIIGTLDINEHGEIHGFENGKSLRDFGYTTDDMLCGNMYSIGKKIGITVDGIPQDIKDFIDTIEETTKKEETSHTTDQERL